MPIPPDVAHDPGGGGASATAREQVGGGRGADLETHDLAAGREVECHGGDARAGRGAVAETDRKELGRQLQAELELVGAPLTWICVEGRPESADRLQQLTVYRKYGRPWRLSCKVDAGFSP